jgi:hypothetical protein
MHFGNHNRYFWLESEDARLFDLLRICPQVVEGKYVVVTACDSGPLKLVEEERALGWTTQGPLAYSPKIERADWVPQGEYDEWYIFPAATRMDIPEVFVNDSGFTFLDPGQQQKVLDPTWDREMHAEWREILSEKQSRFWRQLEAIRPETYVAEGNRLILVTSNLGCYETIRQHL